MYWHEGYLEDAHYLTQRAIFHAEKSENPSQVYQWHWQTGKLLWALGQSHDALQAFSRAVQIVSTNRQETMYQYDRTGSSFRDRVEYIYTDYVDALLKQSKSANAEEQTLLLSARTAIEQLKAAELRDYFRDECVVELESRTVDLDGFSTDTAIIYPITLDDRIELLVTVRGQMSRFSSPVSRREFLREIDELRDLLRDIGSDDYLESSQILHRWLIEPLDDFLTDAGINTLVFVPDGPLLNIPMASLHDGNRFLAEKYSIAITQGLELIDPTPINRDEANLLIAGLSDAVQGFSALRYVPEEVAAIKDMWGGDLLLNDPFTATRFQSDLEEKTYSIVHVASHGVFASKFDESFLLTYDDRISLATLSDMVKSTKYRDKPV